MNAEDFHESRRYVTTDFGDIAYVQRGEGPVALFLHGVPLNGYHWRYALESLSDVRRCIAPDLMGLGYTKVSPEQDLAFSEQARMVESFLETLDIDLVDLVGNDSGGAVAQIFAARAPERLRSLTLTNCDVHDNWPPPALGSTYERPDRLEPETVRVYLEPLVRNDETRANVCRYFLAEDCAQTVHIEERLKALQTPTLVLWGDADVFFPVEWAEWLRKTIPGCERVRVLPGAKLFFPEEHPEVVEKELRAHWARVDESRRAL